MYSGERGRGGRDGARGRSNFEGRSRGESSSYRGSVFRGRRSGPSYRRNSDYGRYSQGFDGSSTVADSGGGAHQETRDLRRNGANTSFGAPLPAPPSDTALGPSGFGTPIVDDSLFRRSTPSAPPSTHTRASSNAIGERSDGGFNSSITPFGGYIPERTESPLSNEAMFRPRSRNDYGRRDRSRSGFRRDSEGNRHGGTMTASARPLTPFTTANNFYDENGDPQSLVKKMEERLNDDGGVYTSDEEDKPPISQKNDCPAKDQSEGPIRTEIPDAPTRRQTIYRTGGRGSHTSQPSRTNDRPAPAAQEVLQPQKPHDAVKQAAADSILLTLLTDHGMRQILKNYSPALFDNMVKHVAVVVETRHY